MAIADLPHRIRELFDPGSALAEEVVHLPIRKMSWLWALCAAVPVAVLFTAAAVNDKGALRPTVAAPVAFALAVAAGSLTWWIVRGVVARREAARPRTGLFMTPSELVIREPGADAWVLPRHRVYSAAVHGGGKGGERRLVVGWTDDDGDHRAVPVRQLLGHDLGAMARAVAAWCTGCARWTAWAFPAREAAHGREFIVVDVRNQGLRLLPRPSFPLPALRKLTLRGNALRELPDHLAALDLRELDVAENQLEALPAWIGDMSGLRVLDLRDNGLRQLPSSLTRLQHLETVYIGGNDFESWPEDEPPAPELMSWLVERPEAVATQVGIGVLARFGGTAGVAPLREVASSRRYQDEVRRQAEEAIARIQARATHAQAGQLSLAAAAGAGAGQLSLTASGEVQGAVTLVENGAAPGTHHSGEGARAPVATAGAGDAPGRAAPWWWLMVRRQPLALLVHALFLVAGVRLAALAAVRLELQAHELGRVRSSVVELPADSAPDPAHEGELVHLTGRLRGARVIVDHEFGVEAHAIWLIRRVDMYQWRESTRTREIGGQQSVKYDYDKVWSHTHLRSSDYRDQSKVNPPSIPWQRSPWFAGEVGVGGFALSRQEVSGLRGDGLARIDPRRVAAAVAALGGGWEHQVEGDFLYLAPARPVAVKAPRVGDIRISWPFLSAAAEASVLAVQTGDGFAPLRLSPLLRAGAGGRVPEVHAVRTGRHAAADLLGPLSLDMTRTVVSLLIVALLLLVVAVGEWVRAFSASGYAVAAERVPKLRMALIGGCGVLGTVFGSLAGAWVSGWWLAASAAGLWCLAVAVRLGRRSALAPAEL